MKNLFLSGGPLFMSILTLLLIVMLAWFIYHYLAYASNSLASKEILLSRLRAGKAIGLFAMICGVLGQMLGLYQAFFAIERAADISPAIIMGGIKISMISTIYGILIYLLAILLWFILDFMVSKK
jgi:hypothetical protein